MPILSSDVKPVLVAIGDSHSKFWSGIDSQAKVARGTFPNVDVLHLGPVTAHNINTFGTGTKGKERLIAKLSRRTRSVDGFIVCMGEIDCRTQIVKAAIKSRTSLDHAVEETVHRYFQFLDWLYQAYAKPILIWGPTATSPIDTKKSHANFPRIGSVIERNYATLQFNKLASGLAETRENFAFATIFNDMIAPDGLSLPHFFYDSIHVSRVALGLAVEKAKMALAANNLAHLVDAFDPWAVSQNIGFTNVAEGLSPIIVSGPEKRTEKPLGISRHKAPLFTLENKAELHVHLRDHYILKSVELCLNEPLPKSVSIELYRGDDGCESELVWRGDAVPTGKTSVVVKVRDDSPIKLLKVTGGADAVTVNELKVMARSFIL
ncbi:hypothetical protein PMI07_001431 [Rhizobium sp. CF080]|uniref:hypothetical protein n=1 Tax=Rhizobium sp. (strain CF080) TaxID=1144310 RepID=UPI0002719A41|nr:hypothetical protein [Rhizobium sp. CF080]EUB96532.1 hypothetical protein PMI07_001431 [Rhizobium sp. CF080]